MALTQSRWLCRTCAREWLDGKYAVGAMVLHPRLGLTPWTPDLGCPTCWSAEIEFVTYTPAFLGGDIPRPGEPAPVLSMAEPEPTSHVQPPPQALLAEPNEADDLAAQWEALAAGQGALA